MCGQFPQATQYNALGNDNYFAELFPPTVMHLLDIFPWPGMPLPHSCQPTPIHSLLCSGHGHLPEAFLKN